jgi:outer membrane lipoprotein
LVVNLMLRVLPLTCVLLLLSACASAPDRFQEGLREPFPQQLAASPQAVTKGQRLTWGGIVIEARNLADRTLLEVLAYPLDRRGRPDTDATPRGRFLADHPGFLEPRDYAPGRAVTVSGALLGYQDGKVGEADYRFPAIAAEQLELWSRDAVGRSLTPRVGVGVGVGSYGSGLGVGIGF